MISPAIRAFDNIYNGVIAPLLAAVELLGSTFSSGLKKRRAALGLPASLRLPPGPRLLVHASSMGEFEQCVAIVKELRSLYPNLVVVGSFFSVSGYEHRGRSPLLDAAVYLPIDTPRRQREFLAAVQPAAILVMRYDLWWGHIRYWRANNVPVVLAAATLRHNSAYYSWARAIGSALYSSCSDIFAMTEEDRRRLIELAPTAVRTAIGDPRFDHIAAAVEAAAEHAVVPRHAVAAPRERILVVGSSWPADEDVILRAVERRRNSGAPWRVVAVPHKPTADHCQALLRRLPGARLLSAIMKPDTGAAAHIPSDVVVDTVGQLLALYSLADAAWVGGGFGAGVHSVTEPAAYGIPVACGPAVERSPDARTLRSQRLLAVCSTVAEAESWLVMMEDDDMRHATGNRFADYCLARRGASHAVAATLGTYIASVQQPVT